MRRAKALLLVLLSLALLAACGGGGHTTKQGVTVPATKTINGHKCDPNNYAMQCALTPPPRNLKKAPPAVAHGIDFGWSCPNPAGENFGASYLSFDHTKNWTTSCVNYYHSRGAYTVDVWETGATEALAGYSAGRSDAINARSQAAAHGNTRVIYFAIDFDETSGQAPLVARYFQGVDSVLGVARVGAYGGYWAVSRLFNARLTSYGWQTYAWSGGRWDGRAQIEQYLNDSSVDYDRAIARDYGQYPHASPPPPPPKQHCLANNFPHTTACYEVRYGYSVTTQDLHKVENALWAHNCYAGTPSSYCYGWFFAQGVDQNKIAAFRKQFQ